MPGVSCKVAFITGGASGIGLDMARVFAAAGLKVAIADVDAAALAAAQADLLATGARVAAVAFEVTKAAS